MNAILARLGLDTAGFKAGLRDAQSQLAGFGKGGFGGALGGTLGVAGITQAISQILEYGDRVQDLSERHNVNAESLQRVGNAAALAGSSMEEVGKGLKFIEVRAELALRGNSKLMQSFANLGITAEDLRNLSPEQILLKIGKSGMEAADMLAVLGKEGLNLRPVLAGIADGTIEMGKAIDALDIKKLDEASDAWKKLKQDSMTKTGTMLAQDTKDIEAFGGLVKRITDQIKIDFEGAGIWNTEEQENQIIFARLAAEKTAGLGPTYEQIRESERGREKPPPVKTKAEQAAESKERDRTKLTVADLAAPHSGDIEFRNNAQAMHAHRTAQEIQKLEADAKRFAELQDPNSARASLDRADQLRQSLGPYGLKESEQTNAVRAALDSSQVNTHLQNIENELTFAGQ